MREKKEYEKELAFLEALGFRAKFEEHANETIQEMVEKYGNQVNIDRLYSLINAESILLIVAQAIKDFYTNDELDEYIQGAKILGDKFTIPKVKILIIIINKALKDYYSNKIPTEYLSIN